MFALAVFELLWARSLRAADLPNLSGTWKLNKDLSDDARQKLREAGSGGGRGSRAGGGRGGGHGRSGGARSADDSGSGARADGEEPSGFEVMNAAMASLKIEHRDPELRITEATGHESVFYTDGRKTEEERSLGGTAKIHAEWKDGHVVVTVAPERGPKTTNTYAVAKDSSQLILTTRLERGHGRPAVEIRRVYDPVK